MEDAGDIGQGFTSAAEGGYPKPKKNVWKGGKVGNIDRATMGYKESLVESSIDTKGIGTDTFFLVITE